MSRQPDFSTSPRPSRVPMWERLAVLGGLAALLLAGTGAWQAQEEARDARARLADVRQKVEASTLRLRSSESRARAGAPRLPASEAPPARIVAALASALPGDARLEGLSIDYQHGGLLEIAVVAREAAAWDRLLDRLSRDPRFDDVRPGPESRDAEVKSTVRARWAGGSR